MKRTNIKTVNEAILTHVKTDKSPEKLIEDIWKTYEELMKKKFENNKQIDIEKIRSIHGVIKADIAGSHICVIFENGNNFMHKIGGIREDTMIRKIEFLAKQ